MTTGPDRPTSSPRRAVRRAVLVVLRSLLVATAVIVGYFALPLQWQFETLAGLGLIIGLIAILGLLAWEIRQIVRSPMPGIQAVAALVITVPIFLVLFATAYYLMSDADASNFSESLTRLDALYFTVTTFATVGFGDITAASQNARAVTLIQMVLGLALVGLIAHVVTGAVQVARKRQRHVGTSDEAGLPDRSSEQS